MAKLDTPDQWQDYSESVDKSVFGNLPETTDHSTKPIAGDSLFAMSKCLGCLEVEILTSADMLG
jgi:hypothetical protein